MKEIKFSFTRDQIIFNIGDEDYYLPKDKMLALIDSRNVANRFDEQTSPDDQLDDMDNFDTVANYLFWKGRGSSMEQVAESMVPPVTIKKLENWTTRHCGFIERIKAEKAADLSVRLAMFDATYNQARRTSKIEA